MGIVTINRSVHIVPLLVIRGPQGYDHHVSFSFFFFFKKYKFKKTPIDSLVFW